MDRKFSEDYSLGQAVVVAQKRNGGNRATGLSDGVVSKIGRVWITVTCCHSNYRFDVEDGAGDYEVGYAPSLYASRAAYEAHAARQQAWDTLTGLMRTLRTAPDHLAGEDILALVAKIEGAN